jgi:hypothetical protein
MIASEQMVILEEFARYTAESHDFGVATVETDRLLAFKFVAQFPGSPGCTGWILRDRHVPYPYLARRWSR